MFSADAKDEIARVRFERSCCPSAFLRALARFTKSRPSTLVVATQRGAIARAAIAAAKSAGIHASANAARDGRLGNGTLFEVRVDSPLGGAVRPPGRACCRRAWLRGAFLACGSVTDPTRGYHLEYFCPDDLSARALCEALAAFGIDALIGRRRGRPLAYVKDAQGVADILGAMGASQAIFALDNVRAMRQTKNDIRRVVNSEAANAARAAASSIRQRDAAMRAIARIGLGRLTAELAQAAQLRIAHPEATLAELAARARPSVAKATMGYRLRRLEALARATTRRDY
jgi:cell division protein WhiA